MIQDQIHKAISAKHDQLIQWFSEKRQGLHVPFYSSFDIRDSGFKVVPVDANLFPAGFNNICQADKETSGELVKKYLNDHYQGLKSITLLTEEHTNNPYYWDNVNTLVQLLAEAGKDVQVAIPTKMEGPLSLESASGHRLEVHSAVRSGKGFEVNGRIPDLVISNNDFSQSYEEWAEGLDIPMNPPREMGWYQRKKHNFFSVYNELVTEFCQLIDFDPWHMRVKTEVFEGFDINSEESRGLVANQVDKIVEDLSSEYKARSLDAPVSVFVKNNSGTYGLGVTKVHSGDDVRGWNNKSRKKMKAAKGGGGVAEVILQEGVPTSMKADGDTAEPAIYMVGCQLAGGFLRAHSKKGPDESLNSPGAVYKRLCVSDLSINVEGHPMENVYGWVARLGILAVASETKSQGIQLKGYSEGSSPDQC